MKSFLVLASVFAVTAFHAAAAGAESATIFAANYHMDFAAGDQLHTIQTRNRVHSGHEIPNELGSYKIGMQIEEVPDGEFLLRLNVYERDGMSWFHINAPAPEFTGELGMPMEVSWESGELRITLAIAVSEYELAE